MPRVLVCATLGSITGQRTAQSANRTGLVRTEEGMKPSACALALVAALVIATGAGAAAAPSPADLMAIHQVEIDFHKAGTTKDLNLMLSLFTDDATVSAAGKTYTGKDQIRDYWTHAGPFLPENHWAGYTPAYKIRIGVNGDRATLYFECLWVDAATGQVKVHSYSDDVLVRTGAKWLIKEMKAGLATEI